MGMTNLDRKLQAGALLARRVEGDGRRRPAASIGR